MSVSRLPSFDQEIYDIDALNVRGNLESLGEYRGKVLLIENTASL